MVRRIHLYISGVVQGVFYRGGACSQASRFHLRGFVRNCRDGRVELVAEGEEADLNAMIVWCRKGPSSAHVRNVEVRWRDATGEYGSFEIAG